jgi:propanol-preferring alcohol dehydrogenase
MRAMVLEQPRTPLVIRQRPTPAPTAGDILVEVAACGVCRTDLHVVDGELPDPKLPIVPGHEIVGRVAAFGEDVTGFAVGERIGVPWLGYTCGICPYCRSGRENLCDRPLFTAIRATAATPRTRLPMRATAFHCRSGAMTPRSRRFFAPG